MYYDDMEIRGVIRRTRARYEVLSHLHVTANNNAENALYTIIILRYNIHVFAGCEYMFSKLT